MIDRTLSRFRIHAPLGADGMGEVYRARDTKFATHYVAKTV